MADHFQLRLVDGFMLAPSVRHLVFERVDGQPVALQPGQFLQVHFHYDDGTATKRSYSVATAGDGSSSSGLMELGRIEIAVSYVEGGAATRLLGDLPVGGVIDASGPYGRFCLQATDLQPRYLLLATGTGVTPYRAMLPQIENCSTAKSSRRSRRPILGSSFTAASVVRRAPCRVPPTAAATFSTCWPSWARTPTVTLPICAATRTWSMRHSPYSRSLACRCRRSGGRSTFHRVEQAWRGVVDELAVPLAFGILPDGRLRSPSR
jgi:hypothetical protein